MQLMRRRLVRSDRGDSGFTLVEVVITVAILGVVTAALCGIVLQYLKTTADTTARLSESTDQQFISTYWQSDVSSLGKRSFATTSVSASQSVFEGAAYTGSCLVPGGSVVVSFAWNDFAFNAVDPDVAWSSTVDEVTYATVPSADAGLSLKRVRCHGGAVGTPHTVALNLTGPPSVACDTTCSSASPLPNRVAMTFTVRDGDHPQSVGYTTTVSADRRQG